MLDLNDTALIVIDVQNDFCPGGALAIEKGDEVVGPMNDLIAAFDNVIFTQDWHPHDHVSFASNQPDKQPFDSIQLDYGEQTLWPPHCIMGTTGAAFHRDLNTLPGQVVVRKGYHTAIDSYSAFFENDKRTSTGLHGYLENRAISHVFLAGLATDYCVAWSAIDAARLGFTTTVVLSACRAIDLDGSLATQMAAMERIGVNLVDTL